MKYKKVFLLSHVLSRSTPCYGGEEGVCVQAAKSMARGDSCNMTRILLSAHAGTHVDAPFHFIAKGKKVTDIQLREWVFSKVNLINIPAKPGYLIGADDMPTIRDCELLLIRTNFEKCRQKEIYWRNSPGLAPELACFLKKKCPSLRAIGIDFISISSLKNRESGRTAHKNFLGNNILLIEDMKLAALKKAPSAILISPIFFENADGAPCTAWGFDNS